MSKFRTEKENTASGENFDEENIAERLQNTPQLHHVFR